MVTGEESIHRVMRGRWPSCCCGKGVRVDRFYVWSATNCVILDVIILTNNNKDILSTLYTDLMVAGQAETHFCS